MADDRRALVALYAQLRERLTHDASVHGEGGLPPLRWVQCPAPGDGTLAIGHGATDAAVASRLPASLTGPRGPVAVRWLPCNIPGRAEGWVRPENVNHSVGQGTLTALMRSSGSPIGLYALTAGHVLGSDPEAAFDDRIRLHLAQHPGIAVDGRAHQWSPDLSLNRKVAIDAGLIRLDEQAVEPLLEGIDWPLGWADVATGDAVRLLTRHHRLGGRVVARMTASVDVGSPPQRYVLEDALVCQIDGGSLPGDSGAPLWDTQQRLVGLHVGSAPPGAAGNTLAVPIARVMHWSGCEPVLRHQALGDEGRRAAPAPAPPAAVSPGTADILARTMWGEARGEPDARAGMTAVAHVVLNRRDMQTWWGRSVEAVCQHPWQFSCWNADDPNRARLIAVKDSDALFAMALTVAGEVLSMTAEARALADRTQRATHYHAASLKPPGWTRNATRCGQIGHHVFYRDVP